MSSSRKPGKVDGLLAFPLNDGCAGELKCAINDAAPDSCLLLIQTVTLVGANELQAKKPPQPNKQQTPSKQAATGDDDDDEDDEAVASSSWSKRSSSKEQPRSFGGGAAGRRRATDTPEDTTPLPPATPIRLVAFPSTASELGGLSGGEWLRQHVLSTREPAVIRGMPLGECSHGKWTAEYLKRTECASPLVSVHVCAAPTVDLAGHRPPNTPRNFVFKSMPFEEAVERCHAASPTDDANDDSSAAAHAPLLSDGERYYLRSVGLDPRREAADFPKLFPQLATECSLLPHTSGDEDEPLLDRASYHSSVLRLASHDTQLWTHFDVMDNLLAQLTGSKRVVMWPPNEDENLYVEGSSSRVADIDAWNDDDFPRFRKTMGSRLECELQPGDVLYIPALWFHNVTSIGFSVALNVFWRSHHVGGPQHKKAGGDPNLYSAKDLYGNRDPPAAARAIELAQQAAAELRRLPEPFKSFYARRAVREIEQEEEEEEEEEVS